MGSRVDSAAHKGRDSSEIGDFPAAAEARRHAAWDLSMSERLAKVHELCKQINAIKGAARGR